MADNIIRDEGVAQNYRFNRGGTPAEFGPFIGVVKNNVDPTRQGRLQVYIEQFAGPDPNDKTLWRTVSYCPSFYGATPPQPGRNPKFFNQPKPVHSFLAAEMFQQGTLGDQQRGPIGSTSQRESPSAVFGVSTPGRAVYQGGLGESDIKSRIASGAITDGDVNIIGRKGGHSIVLDDGDLEGNDKLVRIRSAAGHQITMSDDGNFFYIIHANGQAWLEFGQEGTVDVYATNSVNVRTQGTINLHADKDINMFAGGTINMKSMLGTTIETERKLTLSSTDEMTLYSKARIAVRADGSLAIVSNKGSWNAGGAMVLQADGIDLNGGSTENVEPPVRLEKRVMPDTEFNNATGWQIAATGLESIVTRAPTHEPWPFHNQGVDVEIPMEEGQPTTPPDTPPIPSGWSGSVSGEANG